jgi:hypothetical protein
MEIMMRSRLMDGRKAKAPDYHVPRAFDARNGDPDWWIMALWGLALLISSAICGVGLLILGDMRFRRWWLHSPALWELALYCLFLGGLSSGLAGEVQLRTLRHWLPLSRAWLAALICGVLVTLAVDGALYELRDPFPPGSDYIIIDPGPSSLGLGLGWGVTAVAQALQLRRFSRRAWEWLVPPAAVVGLFNLGERGFESALLCWAAYLLLGTVALVRVLRAAPYPDGPA